MSSLSSIFSDWLLFNVKWVVCHLYSVIDCCLTSSEQSVIYIQWVIDCCLTSSEQSVKYIQWVIDCCLTSNEQFTIYIQWVIDCSFTSSEQTVIYIQYFSFVFNCQNFVECNVIIRNIQSIFNSIRFGPIQLV